MNSIKSIHSIKTHGIVSEPIKTHGIVSEPIKTHGIVSLERGTKEETNRNSWQLSFVKLNRRQQ